MEIPSRLKDVKIMRIKAKNLPLDQTGGPREEELEKNLSQLVHQRRRLPSQMENPKKDPRESFNELMDTPLDFSAFVLNRLKVDTLTLEILAGLTFELMKGSCKSLVELEYFLEEIKSYQKKLNLTKPDTYKSDLKRKTPYTAYSNPIGFIYQNKDKKNRLMRIDELHKFSDGTLNDVRSALDDTLKRIWMKYPP
ncbi:hypothetical protein Tco_1502638 [Tanacetum coccineum]